MRCDHERREHAGPQLALVGVLLIEARQESTRCAGWRSTITARDRGDRSDIRYRRKIEARLCIYRRLAEGWRSLDWLMGRFTHSAERIGRASSGR